MDRNQAETVNLITSGGHEVAGNVLTGLRDMERRLLAAIQAAAGSRGEKKVN
jgi:hypothetical protein